MFDSMIVLHRWLNRSVEMLSCAFLSRGDTVASSDVLQLPISHSLSRNVIRLFLKGMKAFSLFCCVWIAITTCSRKCSDLLIDLASCTRPSMKVLSSNDLLFEYWSNTEAVLLRAGVEYNMDHKDMVRINYNINKIQKKQKVFEV